MVMALAATVLLSIPNLHAPVLPAEPNYRFFDLGPVFRVAESRAYGDPPIDPKAFLLVEADRLGADAFIDEGRTLGDVYAGGRELEMVRFSPGEKVLGGVATAAAVVAALFTGGTLQRSLGADYRTPIRYFRAIRRDRGEQQPAIALGSIEPWLRESFANAKTAPQQMAVANALLARGALEVAAYEKLRRTILSR